MQIVYLLLSPTYGMHLYTADLAADMVQAGYSVHLVTTTTAPRNCYAPSVQIHTPVTTSGTGFAPDGMKPASVRAVFRSIAALSPDVVHITGVHLWNLPLLSLLHDNGIPAIHTIHDLDPHVGVRFAPLIRLFNRLVLGNADHILVHGSCYRDRLISQGMQETRITYLPLLHAFLGHGRAEALKQETPPVRYEPLVLFFGRLLPYKGIPNLLLAMEHLAWHSGPMTEMVLAGPGALGRIWPGLLPDRVSVRNRLIDDDEGHDLFARASLLVLPYIGATQSALVAAANAYAKPVIVTDSGALPEYVAPAETGWVVPANDEVGLAQAMSAALGNKDRLMAMGRASRVRYEEQRLLQPALLQDLYDGLRYSDMAASSALAWGSRRVLHATEDSVEARS